MFNTIKKSDDISELFKNGTIKYFKYFTIFYKNSKDSKIGFIAGKKIGNSVKRNYLRRKLKRFYIENIEWFNNKTAIIVAKDKLLKANDKLVKNDFEKVLKKSVKENF